MGIVNEPGKSQALRKLVVGIPGVKWSLMEGQPTKTLYGNLTIK